MYHSKLSQNLIYHLCAGRGFRTPDLQIMSDAFFVEAGALTRLSFRLDIPAPSRHYRIDTEDNLSKSTPPESIPQASNPLRGRALPFDPTGQSLLRRLT